MTSGTIRPRFAAAAPTRPAPARAPSRRRAGIRGACSRDAARAGDRRRAAASSALVGLGALPQFRPRAARRVVRRHRHRGRPHHHGPAAAQRRAARRRRLRHHRRQGDAGRAASRRRRSRADRRRHRHRRIARSAVFPPAPAITTAPTRRSISPATCGCTNPRYEIFLRSVHIAFKSGDYVLERAGRGAHPARHGDHRRFLRREGRRRRGDASPAMCARSSTARTPRRARGAMRAGAFLPLVAGLASVARSAAAKSGAAGVDPARRRREVADLDRGRPARVFREGGQGGL